MIGFLGSERLAHVWIWNLSPKNSWVLGVRSRTHCDFLLPGYPRGMARESAFAPENQGDRSCEPVEGPGAEARDP
jgi:hypothetical protein